MNVGQGEGKSPEVQISSAINAGAFNDVKELFEIYPDKVHAISVLGPWVGYATRKASPEMISYLLELGLDPNAQRNHSFENALSEASSHGRLEIVKLLHEKGAEIQTQPSTANPLIAAAHGRHIAIVHYLLDAGIDASVRYEVADGVTYDAVCFALEQGARAEASIIALHLTKGDRVAAQKHLDESWAFVIKANNNADGRPIPAPPVLE